MYLILVLSLIYCAYYAYFPRRSVSFGVFRPASIDGLLIMLQLCFFFFFSKRNTSRDCLQGAGMSNVGDGGTGTATYMVTCNADGTGWTNGGQTVTAVECQQTAAVGQYTFSYWLLVVHGIENN